MISVVTPTIRKKGLELVEKSLRNQSIQDYEWLIGSPFDPGIGTWVKDDFTGGFWTLNRMQSKLCRQSQGELIVFWQDFIYARPDALEKFLYNWQKTKGAISGVGDQYSELDEYGLPKVKTWYDPRKTDKYGSFYECNPEDFEINFGCVGKDKLEEVDYFVDEADFQGYGGDNVILAQRLDKIGVKFYLDQTNESYTLRHGRERDDWNENYILFNGGIDKLQI